MDVTPIGVSLQFDSFDFFYQSMYRRSTMKMHKFDKPVSDKEFHSALQLFTNVLQIVQCMASCQGKDEQSEKNRKNANILKSHIFRHDICKVIHFGFQMYTPGKHNEQFLHDLVCFTHIFLEHMEQHAKGRVLMIKTQKKRKVKKQKGPKPGLTQRSEES